MKIVITKTSITDHVKLYSEKIRKYILGEYITLGTDGFGRSDTRKNLRRFFNIDQSYIVITTLFALYKKRKIEDYRINPKLPGGFKKIFNNLTFKIWF